MQTLKLHSKLGCLLLWRQSSETHAHTTVEEGVCHLRGLRVLTFCPFLLRVARLPEPTATRERTVIKNHSGQEINLTPSLPSPPPPSTHSSSLHPLGALHPLYPFFFCFLSSQISLIYPLTAPPVKPTGFLTRFLCIVVSSQLCLWGKWQHFGAAGSPPSSRFPLKISSALPKLLFPSTATQEPPLGITQPHQVAAGESKGRSCPVNMSTPSQAGHVGTATARRQTPTWC